MRMEERVLREGIWWDGGDYVRKKEFI